MIVSELEKAAAVLWAWQEQKDNPTLNGAIGVLFVIRNRALLSSPNKSWVEVVDDLARVRRPLDVFPDVRDPKFQQLMAAVEPIYDGTRKDNLTGGAVMYSSVNVPAPYGSERTATIGDTNFFRLTEPEKF